MSSRDFEHHDEVLNGRRQHFVTLGDGEPVLFLHGFPDLWRTWQAQMQAVADAGYRAIAPDLRGFGETEGDDDPLHSTVIDVLGDLIAILDHLEVEQVAVVAHDWGADTGWAAVKIRPDRFAAILTITVPWAPHGDASLPQVLQRYAPPTYYYLPWFLIQGPADAEFDRDPTEFLRRIYYTNSAEGSAEVPTMQTVDGSLLAGMATPSGAMQVLPDDELELYADSFAKSGGTAALNAYRSMHRSWELLSAWADVVPTVPARTIVGDRDVILGMPGVRQALDLQSKWLPRGKPTIWLENCGHFAQLERPDDVSRHIVDFLGETLGNRS